VALFATWQGSVPAAIVAGISAASGIALWARGSSGSWPATRFLLLDAMAVGLLANAVLHSERLWGLPWAWWELVALTPQGGIAAAGLYMAAIYWGYLRWREHVWQRGCLLLLLVPVLFNLLLLLACTPRVEELGWRLSLFSDIGVETWRIIGRTVVLVLFTEAVMLGVGFVMDQRWTRSLRLHGLVIGAAALAALSPLVADAPSWMAASAIPLLARVLAIAAAALAFAALWGQTFFATGILLDALYNRRPSWRASAGHWRSGAVKGAVYGGTLMALVHLAAVIAGNSLFQTIVAAAPLAVGGALGVLLFPLARTIMESFDGSPPFFRRLWANAQDPVSYGRGLVAGLGVALALTLNVPLDAAWTRFLFGAVAGALCYAGVDLAADLLAIGRGIRQRVQGLRVYALGIMLGGIVGGALAWYLDAPQLAAVAQKAQAYAAIARAPEAYVIYPLFSKWGSIDVGLVTGGTRLLFNESVAGVINWSLAAPLFSLNLVLLTALFEWRLEPIKALFSARGLIGLVEQATRVLRWGLWMAPIIFTFLKMSPDPTWYNQDGAIRTAVVTIGSSFQSAEAFRAFSLQLFLGLLAYDWLRVLIWFDHMGLRVATLVNLSFIGGDRLDERAGQWLGHSARTRVIPEGIRRFATWAPLLIPFYIPRGAEWDEVWTGAERVASAPAPLLPAVSTLLYAYGAVAAALGAVLLVQWGRRRFQLPLLVPHGPRAGANLLATNGIYTVELDRDGRGYSRVMSAVRPGFEIDITRRPDDPLQVRGKLVYLREVDRHGQPLGAAWSLGREPVGAVDENHAVEQLSPTSLRMANGGPGLAAELRIEIPPDLPVELWQIRLENRESRSRFIELTTYQEFGLHSPGAYQRTPGYNAMHIGTWFLGDLRAILARNRLLKRPHADPAQQHMSREIAFHAAGTAGGAARLVAYQDNRACFIGHGTLREPAAMRPDEMRDPADEGLLYTFDPIASLRLVLELAPGASVELPIVDGFAADEHEAARLIAKALGLQPPRPEALAAGMERVRELIEPSRRRPELPSYSFSADGTELRTTPDTTRPWGHVMANALGQGAIVSNDGEMFSFNGNAQQNGLTPFGLDLVPSQLPSQLVYVADLDTREMHTATFVPYRRADASYDVRFGRGYAVFTMARDDLELELTSTVLPDVPVELRILKIRNRSAATRHLRVASYAQVALAEHPMDTRWTGIATQAVQERSTLLFASHGHDFRRGWAFTSLSLACEAHETIRARFIGGDHRDLTNPCFVEFGGPDTGRPDDGFRCAALSGTVEVAGAGEAVVSMVIGQAGGIAEALDLAQRYRVVPEALRALDGAKRWWSDLLGELRVETNLPVFDRMVNDWLPYQALTARLWGRAGPSQRSGAFGFRDQLQDVLAFLPRRPELVRRQILLHAGQQFVEGDVLKWWHVAWRGDTARGERTKASDPHVWLPYVAARYVEATGDLTVLDETVPFIEGAHIPPDRDGMLVSTRPSRDRATVWEHCRRCVALALRHQGQHGLPLMGTGDWNDGFDLVGRKGRGESGFVGFLLYAALDGMSELGRRRGDVAAERTYREQADRLRAALETTWRGDRYFRATMDDGRELITADAVMAAWPGLSGAAGLERGLEAMETGLKALVRDGMVLLLDRAFDESSDPYPGRIGDYPPGVRENGGQYSHGASWMVDSMIRLALQAERDGRADLARDLRARAVEVWLLVSPADEIHPDRIDRYGLPPHQQPADVYFGPGYEARGGWGWYTGSAGRMLEAAYAILGLRLKDGQLIVPDDLHEPKGQLQVSRLTRNGQVLGPQPTRQPAVTQVR
jgi:cyclic beta-1,2-glucan synthetase